MRQLEIESKFVLDDSSLLNVRRYLSKHGRLISSEHHRDTYLSPRDHHYLEHQYPFEWLSVRTRGSESTLNYKHFRPEGAEKHEYADEVDIPIPDAEAILGLLLGGLRCEIVAVVDKRRSHFALEGDRSITVALDEVEGLGAFVELEVLLNPDASEEDIALARSSLDDLARSLSLADEDLDARGYPYRLIEKNGLFNDRSVGP